MPDSAHQFPLFPLGIVALPTETVPLHIFEERFKALVAHCLEHRSEFGIVWLSDDGLKDVGCAVEIADVLERLPDGRMNIATRGTRPLRIRQRVQRLAYPAGEVEFLADDEEPPDAEAADEARIVYADIVEQVTDERPGDERLAAMSSYAMAATVDLGLDAKQGLLELRSENARLRLLARLLRSAARRLEFVAGAHERARSNGKVRFD